LTGSKAHDVSPPPTPEDFSVQVIDSVAAVFCCEDRLFIVRRQPHLNAFPGYDSFPGGKIDAEDPVSRHPDRFLRDWDGQKMHALVREIREELAYSLPAGIASGQVTSVKFLAEALTPAIVPIRFRLHFFRIDLQTLPTFTPDSGEFADTFWETPRQALDRFHQGDALMVPPLRWVLEELCRKPQGCNFGDLSPQFDEDRYVPVLEPLSGLRVLPVPCNTVPPANRTNAFLLGDNHAPKILVDPSPESPRVLGNLLRTLREDRVSALFLTHHHPDHHEYAPDVARHLGVPVWMSEDTRSRIVEKQGGDYFSGLKIEVRRDGDRLTKWKGEAVLVHEVPGHDAGQLALAPESLRWFIVGDLIQSVGTVVIAAPEGDMAEYFRTLERLIRLGPAVIIPSHGMPMRGTFRLRATLQHRREREEAIRELHVNGKTPLEMLDIIYPAVDRHLLPLAMENIKSHLAKLRRDGTI
jgi:glyoxylase-like metal-dependent hydrolase (beta-lactamase superfamily II)/8-oxo-dGTP pyrophosphatase MutT (NUDIX family)